MCTGGFAKCLGITLIPLAIVSVLCNILLFFPGGKVADTSDHITEEVFYMGGLLGSGVLVSLRVLLVNFVGVVDPLGASGGLVEGLVKF